MCELVRGEREGGGEVVVKAMAADPVHVLLPVSSVTVP